MDTIHCLLYCYYPAHGSAGGLRTKMLCSLPPSVRRKALQLLPLNLLSPVFTEQERVALSREGVK